jgi:hypothetical protein
MCHRFPARWSRALQSDPLPFDYRFVRRTDRWPAVRPAARSFLRPGPKRLQTKGRYGRGKLGASCQGWAARSIRALAHKVSWPAYETQELRIARRMTDGSRKAFADLQWEADVLRLGDLVFRLQHFRNPAEENPEELCLYKLEGLMDEYRDLFERKHAGFQTEHLLELGIWEGGSVALWNELLAPTIHVAVDLRKQSREGAFDRYLGSRRDDRRIVPIWSFDQADAAGLRRLVVTYFGGTLDLVIDDASHLYDASRGSFETLFPFVRAGGLYIIEDWAWAHWKDFQGADHLWAAERPLAQLIHECVEATGSSTGLISSVAVYHGFVAIERGPRAVSTPVSFSLAQHISRRAETTRPSTRARIMALRRRLATLRRGWSTHLKHLG